jgi:Fe-S-cluster containining protein
MTDLLPVLESCDGCGACCRHMIVPPFVLSGGRNEAAEKGVPSALIDELRPLWDTRLLLPESPCLWFDETTLRCRHYDLRPDACRDFERNSDPCRECRRKWDIA